jgi:Double zinc ribbon
VLSPAYFAVGFIVYFLMREPLPYSCPQCGTTVGARFNYCPNCKCNLHPSCPQCKREVAEGDKFCPYCAQELAPAAIPGGIAGAGTESVSGTTPGESAAIDRSS